MVDLPKDVQWLLDFANLGCKQGEANLQSLDIMPILNRPPVKEPEVTGLLRNLPHSGLNTFTDEQGNEWLDTRGKPVYLGKSKYPSRLEFETFFTRNGADTYLEIVISNDQKGLFLFQGEGFWSDMAYDYLQSFWVIARRALFSAIGGERGFNTHELQESVLRKYYELSGTSPSDIKGSVFAHGGDMPCALYANILNLQENRKEYHSCLMACKYCGTFFLIAEKQKGRRRVFCGNECKVSFHLVSSDTDSKRKKKNRERKDAKKPIIKILRKAGFTEEEAEEIYNKEKQKHPKNVASADEFHRTYGTKNGIEKQ